jgi:hypothetical protein
MLSFLLRTVVSEFIKSNFTYIQGKVKYTSSYIYYRLYTTKKEKSITAIPKYKIRERSKSI